jgi:hypothetical protein
MSEKEINNLVSQMVAAVIANKKPDPERCLSIFDPSQRGASSYSGFNHWIEDLVYGPTYLRTSAASEFNWQLDPDFAELDVENWRVPSVDFQVIACPHYTPTSGPVFSRHRVIRGQHINVKTQYVFHFSSKRSTWVDEAVKALEELHDKQVRLLPDIESGKTELRESYEKSSFHFIFQAFNKYPIEATKISSLCIGLMSAFGLVLGKLLNRVFLAPDLGLCIVILSITLFATAIIREKSQRET